METPVTELSVPNIPELIVRAIPGTLERMVQDIDSDGRQVFSRRLNEALRNAGYPARGAGARLSREVRPPVSERAAGKWINGESMPDTKRLGQIATLLGVSVEWLLTGREGMTGKSEMIPLIGTKVPVIDFPTIPDALADRTVSPATMAVDWIYPPMKEHGPRTFAFKQPDASMASPGEDSLPAGCFLYVDPDQTIPMHDKPVLARLESGAVLVGHYMNQGGRVWLRMLNPAYPPVSESFTVLGLVIGLFRDL